MDILVNILLKLLMLILDILDSREVLDIHIRRDENEERIENFSKKLLNFLIHLSKT